VETTHELPDQYKGHNGHKGSDLGWRTRLGRLVQHGAGLFLSVLCVLCVEEAGVQAQAPDYSGTWKLNPAASQITKGTGITGLGAAGAPPTLYVSQAANGTVVVGSDINESHARTFRAAPKALTHEEAGVRESLTLSADGQTLTVRVTAAPRPGATGSEITSTLVYGKVQSEDPCEKWPTPCRYATGRGAEPGRLR
jgi:hypothetical protein